jgi:predicted nucleic acid-binding protein
VPGGPVLVDSGGWIALLSARDQHHAEADTLFRRAVRDRVPLVTTNLVLAEVHRFILFRVGIRAAAVALARIESSPSVRIEFATKSHHQTARTWLAQFPDQRLTYTDATSFAVMRATKCVAALTFDHHFTVAGFTTWR